MEPAIVGQKVKQTWANGVAKDGRAYKNIPDAEIGSMYILKNGDTGLKALGFNPATTTQIDKRTALDEAGRNAQAVLDVLDRGKTGKLRGKSYDDALNFAAGKYTASKAFGEGGKNLTATELAQLAGTQPRTELRGPNVLQKWMGITPPQTGRVVDSPEEIRHKMNLALGRDVNAGADSGGAGIANRLITGGAREIANIGQLLGAGAQAGVEVAKDVGKTGGQNLQWQNLIPAYKEAGKAVLGGVNEQLGRPTEGGDVLGRAGNYAVDNPISTIGAALPAIKGAQVAGAGGRIAGGTTRIAGKLPEIRLPKAGSLIEDIKGRAATNVGVADIESIPKSEQLMKEALQATSAITPRGMSKQLTSITPKAGAHIDTIVNNLDKKIGHQPLDEVIDQIMQKVDETSSAQANSQLSDIVRANLRKQLSAGALEGGMARGQVEATNLGKINATRKYLNSPLSTWFRNGQPIGTPANDLNAMNWTASNALKDILGEADAGGELGKAIRLQHAAMSVGPVLANKVLSSTKTRGFVSALAKYIVDPIKEPLDVITARFLQGAPDNVVRDIRSGALPPIESAPASQTARVSALPPIMPAAQNVPKEVIDTILKGKGEPQATRLLRDNRYTTGSWRPRSTTAERKATEKMVERSKKKRYK